MSLILANNVTINNIDDIKDIIHYFDEIMALHDLIVEYKNVDVNANDNNNHISFDVIFKGCDDASRLYNVIQRKEVSKYGHIFIPILTLNYNILNVKLIDKLN